MFSYFFDYEYMIDDHFKYMNSNARVNDTFSVILSLQPPTKRTSDSRLAHHVAQSTLWPHHHGHGSRDSQAGALTDTPTESFEVMCACIISLTTDTMQAIAHHVILPIIIGIARIVISRILEGAI